VTWGEALLAEAATHPRYWEVAVFKAAKEPHPGTEECILRAKSPPLAVKALERYTQYVFRAPAAKECVSACAVQATGLNFPSFQAEQAA
ncbi:TTN, partial [Symbiodinium necroappetens]